MDIISINWGLLCIHTTKGTIWCQDNAEIERRMEDAMERIMKRPNALERWDEWEIPGGDHKKLERLLIGRCRNNEEKALVRRYMAAGSSGGGLTKPCPNIVSA